MCKVGVEPNCRGVSAPKITVCHLIFVPSCVLSSVIVLPSANLCARFVLERPILNFSRFLTRLQRFTLPAGLSSMPLYSAGFGLSTQEPESNRPVNSWAYGTSALLCCGLLTARRASDFSSIGKSAFRHSKSLVAWRRVEPRSKGIDPLPLPNPAI